MKRWCVVLLCLTVLTVWGSSVSFSEEIVHISTGEYPPRFSEDMDNQGIICHIVREAFALEGIQVKFTFYPWIRALKMVQSGKMDGSILWQKNPEREQYLYFSDPIIEGRWMLFYLKDHPIDWETFKDLETLTIGTVRGYTYGQTFDRLVESGRIHTEEVADPFLNIKKLLGGRFEAFIHQSDSAYYYLQRNLSSTEAQQITHHPKPIQTFFLSLVLSKHHEKNRRYLQLFNRGLATLRERGVLQQLLDEYHLKAPQ